MSEEVKELLSRIERLEYEVNERFVRLERAIGRTCLTCNGASLPKGVDGCLCDCAGSWRYRRLVFHSTPACGWWSDSGKAGDRTDG
jgi:hypothetical protein